MTLVNDDTYRRRFRADLRHRESIEAAGKEPRAIPIRFHPARLSDEELERLLAWSHATARPAAPKLAITLDEIALLEQGRRDATDGAVEPELPLIRMDEWTAADVADALEPLICITCAFERGHNLHELFRCLLICVGLLAGRLVRKCAPPGALLPGSLSTDPAGSEVR